MMTNADAALEAAMEPGCCAPVEPMIATDEQVEAAKASAVGVTAILFKTPTCPNCKAAGALLDKAGVAYQALNANEEKELVEKFGIKQAPTLVLVDGDNFEKYRGVSDIKGWLMNR
ncbi:MAG: hypothetical protein J5928_03290 [Firmicutes bacterium]|nr:hypothetical protein [Bacillota bacterium]